MFGFPLTTDTSDAGLPTSFSRCIQFRLFYRFRLMGSLAFRPLSHILAFIIVVNIGLVQRAARVVLAACFRQFTLC